MTGGYDLILVFLFQRLPSLFLPLFFRNKYFQWTYDHDVIMCREVLLSAPYNFKLRSIERGQAWDSIAQRNNAIDQPSFRVTARSVRDRFSLLSTKQAQKLREEEKASGIDVVQTELDILLEDILEREKEAKLKLESQDVEKKNKVEKEKGAAEEIRKQALQRMAKRNSEDAVRQKPAKVRRSTADAIEYLKMRSEKEVELKREELEVRKTELKLASEKHDQANKDQQTILAAMMTQLQQQQQQQQQAMQAMMAQQENQNKILMALIEKKI